MRKILLFLFFLSLTLPIFSQKIEDQIKDTIPLPIDVGMKAVLLKGKIISIEDNKALQSAHIINLNCAHDCWRTFYNYFVFITIPIYTTG